MLAGKSSVRRGQVWGAGAAASLVASTALAASRLVVPGLKVGANGLGWLFVSGGGSAVSSQPVRRQQEQKRGCRGEAGLHARVSACASPSRRFARWAEPADRPSDRSADGRRVVQQACSYASKVSAYCELDVFCRPFVC